MLRNTLVFALLLGASACGPRNAPVADPHAVVLTDERIRELEEQLFALTNEARVREGKPRLQYDTQLANVARAHSTDMRDHDFFSHTSPTTGQPNERLGSVGLRSSLVLENLGRGNVAAEVHQGWIDSPSHRANIMNADVNRVGVGIVPVMRNGQAQWIATELFARLTDTIDVASAPAVVLASVNAARHTRNASALTTDVNLQATAQEAAQRFFAEPTITEQVVLDDASSSMRRFAIQFRRVSGVMTVVTSLDEANLLEPVLDGEVRTVGIGVAQGTRPDTSTNAIVVVYMLGWPRQ